MRQVVIIHGGTSFNSHDRYINSLNNSTIDYERLKKQNKWKEWLADEYKNGDVLLPSFPNSSNAVYDEWKIYFDKLLVVLGDDVQFIGYSLGGTFLAKCLQQSPLTAPAKRLILVSAAYDDESIEDLGSFKIDSANRLQDSAKEVHLFHSQDDFVAPFTELAKFQQDLPAATAHIFRDRNHFFQPTFPELLELIKK